jgi:RimJ/RimL family protein N-acetyltransferase
VPKNYRTLWLSDIHLGTNAARADDLLDFLDEVSADKIFLAGDIVDLQRMKTRAIFPDSLWLSAFVADDARAVFDYARNPRVARHTTWTPHQSLADAEGFIDMVRGYDDGFCWAIRMAPDGPARGAVEFCLSDSSHGSVHYVLAEELWNRGLMTEAVTTVLQWAFEIFDSLERVTTTATMAGHAAVGVHDDLASGEAAVAHGPADHEPAGRIDVEFRAAG